MTTLPELTGLIAEALSLDPMQVQKHATGLVKSERIDPDNISSECAVDLLMACLSTDPQNVTGHYHLPFSGLLTKCRETMGVQIHDGSDPALKHLDEDCGLVLSRIMSGLRCAAPDFPRLKTLMIGGAGSRMSVCFVMDGPDLIETYWFGYRPLHELLEMIESSPPTIERGVSVSGRIVQHIAELLEGATPIIPMPPASQSQSMAVN